MKPQKLKAESCFWCIHFKQEYNSDNIISSIEKCIKHSFEFDIDFSPVFNKCPDFEVRK
jgi:hypothetical protein